MFLLSSEVRITQVIVFNLNICTTVQVIKHSGSDQLLLMMRLMEGSVQTHTQFSCHPGAVGTFFTLLLLGLKTCECLVQNGSLNGRVSIQLLRDRIYRCI